MINWWHVFSHTNFFYHIRVWYVGYIFIFKYKLHIVGVWLNTAIGLTPTRSIGIPAPSNAKVTQLGQIELDVFTEVRSLPITVVCRRHVIVITSGTHLTVDAQSSVRRHAAAQVGRAHAARQQVAPRHPALRDVTAETGSDVPWRHRRRVRLEVRRVDQQLVPVDEYSDVAWVETGNVESQRHLATSVRESHVRRTRLAISTATLW